MTAKYRRSLPQLTSKHPFLTEGGIETSLIYDKKLALSYFASIVLLKTPEGTEILHQYYETYLNVALRNKVGMVLETRTWRGSRSWAEKLELSVEELMNLNRRAVALVLDVQASFEAETTPIVISGNVGPLSDAYGNKKGITFEAAREQYLDQIRTLVESGVDLISAMTMTNTDEIKAIADLAKEFNMPLHVSFNLEFDGRLLNGSSLEDVILEVDKATSGHVTYFGINCAHPNHILPVLKNMPEEVQRRIGSIRGNASEKSHKELDNSAAIDRGDVELFAARLEDVSQFLPGLKVIGGCCGTDDSHLQAVTQRILRL